MNIKDIKQYNIESIKSIYKEDLLESESHSNDYILNNYFYNHIYFNSIECPDKLVGKNGVHTFSSKQAKINSEKIIKQHNLYTYNQFISQQDIDWDNAYLKYLDPNFIKSNTVFSYNIIKNVNGKIVVDSTAQEPITDAIPDIIPQSQYIKTTNDLMIIIDYLLNRYNRLKKLLLIVKEQLKLIND